MKIHQLPQGSARPLCTHAAGTGGGFGRSCSLAGAQPRVLVFQFSTLLAQGLAQGEVLGLALGMVVQGGLPCCGQCHLRRVVAFGAECPVGQSAQGVVGIEVQLHQASAVCGPRVHQGLARLFGVLVGPLTLRQRLLQFVTSRLGDALGAHQHGLLLADLGMALTEMGDVLPAPRQGTAQGASGRLGVWWRFSQGFGTRCQKRIVDNFCLQADGFRCLQGAAAGGLQFMARVCRVSGPLLAALGFALQRSVGGVMVADRALHGLGALIGLVLCLGKAIGVLVGRVALQRFDLCACGGPGLPGELLCSAGMGFRLLRPLT